MIERLIPVVIGYFCGSIPTGYLYAKARGVDIRKEGSGNIGMTNSMRTLGVKAGVVTLIGDLGKAVVAVLIAWLIFGNRNPEILPLIKLYAGFGAVLGHMFSFAMHFNGGKGIATTTGVMVVLCPFELPLAVSMFLVVAIITKYVSLGSLVGVLLFFVQALVFGELGFFAPLDRPHLIEFYVICGVITALSVIRHRENIKRLIKGTENKFTLKNKKNLQQKEEENSK